MKKLLILLSFFSAIHLSAEITLDALMNHMEQSGQFVDLSDQQIDLVKGVLKNQLELDLNESTGQYGLLNAAEGFLEVAKATKAAQQAEEAASIGSRVIKIGTRFLDFIKDAGSNLSKGAMDVIKAGGSKASAILDVATESASKFGGSAGNAFSKISDALGKLTDTKSIKAFFNVGVTRGFDTAVNIAAVPGGATLLKAADATGGIGAGIAETGANSYASVKNFLGGLF